ncbi:MAG: Ig-like domain-containing protein [Chitinophagaceae bacterium]|nr:Ig-like domain-containing protein [Chitinophagaceae bacterium]
MKNKLLTGLIALFCFTATYGQTPYNLSGSSYTQSFDNLGSGLPSGWRVDSLVKPSGPLGNNAISRFSSTKAAWSSTTRGFKNVASADGLTSTATSGLQDSSVDRALAVRQVGASGWDDHDTLVSMSFNVANTNGLSAFSLQFKIMSLSTTAKRYNNWIVQYGLGATPSSFTTVTTTPTTITMDSNFTTVNVTAIFGANLDNQSQPVWIRICPLDSTLGTGNRPLVAIDDFSLSWTGSAVNNTPQVLGYTPAPGTTNVPIATSNLLIDFDKNITLGTGNVTVRNTTDGTNQTIAASTCTVSGMTVTIPGVTLATGKAYAVKYDSTCFKYLTYSCAGVYDTLSWTFSTTPAILPPVTSLNETFTNCTNSAMGLFTQQSLNGTQTWRCSSFGRTDSFSVYMNGGTAASSSDNEDWLLSPRIDVSGIATPYLHFWTKRRFSGTNTKEVFISSNYTNDVTAANWGTAIVPNMAGLDSNNWNQIKNISLNAYKASPFTIAFRYESFVGTPSVAEEWTIDDIMITNGPVSVSTVQFQDIDMYVVSNPNMENTQCVIVSDIETNLVIEVRDVTGKILTSQNCNVMKGRNTFVLPTSQLPSSLYFVTASNKQSKGVVKFTK